jgi:hypothetical protein
VVVPGSYPAIASSATAVSSVVWAIGPSIGTPPAMSPKSGPIDTRPRVGLSAITPQHAAGIRSDGQQPDVRSWPRPAAAVSRGAAVAVVGPRALFTLNALGDDPFGVVSDPRHKAIPTYLICFVTS